MPVYKKVSQMYSVIIGQYHFYKLFKKYLKTLFLNNCHPLKILIAFV